MRSMPVSGNVSPSRTTSLTPQRARQEQALSLSLTLLTDLCVRAPWCLSVVVLPCLLCLFPRYSLARSQAAPREDKSTRKDDRAALKPAAPSQVAPAPHEQPSAPTQPAQSASPQQQQQEQQQEQQQQQQQQQQLESGDAKAAVKAAVEMHRAWIDWFQNSLTGRAITLG